MTPTRTSPTTAPVAAPVAELVRILLGEENPRMSHGDKLRWRQHGSLVVDTRANSFYDFEKGCGGGPVELVEHFQNCDWRDARDWLCARGYGAYCPPPKEEKKRGWQRKNRITPHAIKPIKPILPPTSGTRDAADVKPDQRALSLWRAAGEVKSTLGERYLAGRGLEIPADAGRFLRFHPACFFGRERRPAVLTLGRNIATGKPQCIQRTFLNPDGSKDCRMSLGSTTGAVVMVSPDEGVETGLAIAEGVADALALLQAGLWLPVWATFGTSGMHAFPVLPGIERLAIYCDNDNPGRDAAYHCWKRWQAAGRHVEVVEPTGKDFGAVACESFTIRFGAKVEPATEDFGDVVEGGVR